MTKSEHGKKQPVVARVYDILNCGPHHRFVANDKLVKNSGSNRLNLQNLPRGGAIRHCLHAPKGHMLIVSDLAQIEARMLAWFANEEFILDAFRSKKDLYCEMASKIFNRPINKKDHPDERWVGKSVILGAGYGMGANKFRMFCKSMGRNLEESYCQELINKYRSTATAITSFWQLMQAYLPYFSTTTPLHILGGKLTIHNNRLILPSSRALHYEEMRYEDYSNRYRLKDNKIIYGAKMVENIVQAAARDVFTDRLLAVHNTVCPVIMHSHDELICVVPESEIVTTAEAIQELMCQPPDWCKDLPLDAETSVAYTYGEAK